MLRLDIQHTGVSTRPSSGGSAPLTSIERSSRSFGKKRIEKLLVVPNASPPHLLVQFGESLLACTLDSLADAPSDALGLKSLKEAKSSVLTFCINA